MTRRWRLLVSLALLLLVGSVLALPAVHWRLIGWVKSEAFYDGRPTCWWAREVQEHLDSMSVTFHTLQATLPREPRGPSADSFLRLFMHASNWGNVRRLRNDPAGLPVLTALTAHQDIQVRHFAAHGIRNLCAYELDKKHWQLAQEVLEADRGR